MIFIVRIIDSKNLFLEREKRKKVSVWLSCRRLTLQLQLPLRLQAQLQVPARGPVLGQGLVIKLNEAIGAGVPKGPGYD